MPQGQQVKGRVLPQLRGELGIQKQEQGSSPRRGPSPSLRPSHYRCTAALVAPDPPWRGCAGIQMSSRSGACCELCGEAQVDRIARRRFPDGARSLPHQGGRFQECSDSFLWAIAFRCGA
jgi:hypothetical protein